jgi:hypothetical protein
VGADPILMRKRLVKAPKLLASCQLAVGSWEGKLMKNWSVAGLSIG